MYKRQIEDEPTFSNSVCPESVIYCRLNKKKLKFKREGLVKFLVNKFNINGYEFEIADRGNSKVCIGLDKGLTFDLNSFVTDLAVVTIKDNESELSRELFCSTADGKIVNLSRREIWLDIPVEGNRYSFNGFTCLKKIWDSARLSEVLLAGFISGEIYEVTRDRKYHEPLLILSDPILRIETIPRSLATQLKRYKIN